MDICLLKDLKKEYQIIEDDKDYTLFDLKTGMEYDMLGSAIKYRVDKEELYLYLSEWGEIQYINDIEISRCATSNTKNRTNRYLLNIKYTGVEDEKIKQVFTIIGKEDSLQKILDNFSFSTLVSLNKTETYQIYSLLETNLPDTYKAFNITEDYFVENVMISIERSSEGLKIGYCIKPEYVTTQTIVRFFPSDPLQFDDVVAELVFNNGILTLDTKYKVFEELEDKEENMYFLDSTNLKLYKINKIRLNYEDYFDTYIIDNQVTILKDGIDKCFNIIDNFPIEKLEVPLNKGYYTTCIMTGKEPIPSKLEKWEVI